VSRDGFEVPENEPLHAAHARIDALLDEIAVDKPLTYSMSLDITAYETGRALTKAPEAQRTETAAAALLRYTVQSRSYTGGIYSPQTYTVNDYRVVVSRVAQALLRSKMKFEEALLVRLLTEVADYAGENTRSYPVKSLLGQVENFVKHAGALPEGLRAPLQVMIDKVTADAKRYPPNGKPPLILREVSDRAKALLSPPTRDARAKRNTKPR
jgi:hypothetical protein